MTTTPAPAIDLLSPTSFAAGQPHEQYRWLREHDPIHWHAEPDGPGFWAITRYADVRAVGRDATTFSSIPTVMIPDMAGAMDLGEHRMMLTCDPPAHTKLRRHVSPDFIPRAARALRPRIGALATQIVDGVIERGECDLVEDLAGLMPSYVIAEMLGIPHADGVELYKLTEAIHAAPESQAPGAGMAAVLQMFNYAHDVWNAKQADPGDDLASKLVHGNVDGHRLDEIDFNLFFLLLVDAGGDTTRNLVAGGMLALFEFAKQRARLQRDVDTVLPTAIDEMLRWVSPVIYMRRTATRDTKLGDTAIAAGDRVVMYYGSANRDDAAFVDADQFDVTRSPNEHVAFGGGGPHFCLGAHIARIEIAALLREIVTRLPDMEPAGSAEWLPSNFISGPKHIPVRFSPGVPSGS
jgi:cytochrome P450